jgi:amino acid adenylation domain-containing protein
MAPSVNGTHDAREASVVNANRRILPGPQLLHELVAKASEKAIILDFLQADDRRVRITYEDFHRITDLLSRDIREQLSVQAERRHIIPVIVPQCPELYIAWVAVLKSGAAFCPVSHDVPAERLKFILRDVDATFVLATSATSNLFRDALAEVKCKVLSLKTLRDRLESIRDGETDSQAGPAVEPSSPAYVMYTSGSTGLPKGVMVSHLSVSQSLLAHDEHIPRFRRFLQFASPTFDVSIFEIFFPFFRGATLVGCERERMLSDLPATILALNADAAELTPTVAGTLLRTREAAPCLKTLLTIGEMLTAQVVSEFGGTRDTPSMLYAMYGPTEAAIHCTVATRLAADASIRSIGQPLSTVSAFILQQGEPPKIAPVGESGELAIAGQLADGYLNRPKQNRAAFIDLPGYGAIYKTGDRATCRPNGELEILGRMSTGQVKLRGQRVELGEIEEIASKTKGVQMAIASIIDDVLVLFCVARPDVGAAAIHVQCKSWLPPYMRPGEIIFLHNDVPRLASGKIDRKALERNYREQRSAATQGGTFRSRIEEDIAKVLSRELRTQIDRSTSFWSLGLDSLRAIKVASQLREKYSSVSAAIISEADNVAELAVIVGNSPASENLELTENEFEASDEWQEIKQQLPQRPTLARHDRSWEEILPCSSMQVAMLVETATKPAQNFNDIWLRLTAGAMIADLRRAFDKLAEKNKILRSGFVPTGSQKMPFAQIVWHSLVDTELTLLRPLQLTQGPRDSDDVVHVRIHHALYDGWSWDLIVDDLNAILSGHDAPKRTPFCVFRSFEQRQLQSETSVNHEFWENQFVDFKPSAFPNLSATRKERLYRGCTELPLSVSYQQLSDVALSLRCGRETILEAAWSLLLSSYTNETDVAIGVVSAGRHHSLPGIESIIGPCLSMFPLRVDINALRTAHDLVNHIQRLRNLCQKHGNIPLRDINHAAGVRAGDRLFDTLCVWQQDSTDNDRDRSQVVTISTADALDYSIVLEFEPRHGKIHVKLNFDAERVPEDHGELIARQLDEVITHIMNRLELPLHDIWEGTSRHIASMANTKFEQFSESFDLVSTVENLAESCPSRVAVEFVHDLDVSTGRVGRELLTYGDLFKRASIIASALQRKYTVGVDDLVCLIGPRSTELYIGILGTIMAGGAYMCIDPRTPAERSRSILGEANSKLVLIAGNAQAPSQFTAVQTVSIASLLAKNPESGVSKWPALTGGELAYAVFTSGSTGVPKGVLLTRRNLLSNLEVLSRIYPCNPATDRLLQSCSPAFDVSVFEIFWTWHMGMTLCTASNDVLFRDLESFITELNITHLSMTPSVAALVRPGKVPHVKMLVTAGEPMNSRVFSDWADRGLYQGYGPSETTNICNVRPCVSNADASNNVGPPLSNTSVFVCQRQASDPRHSINGTVNGTSHQAALNFRPIPTGGVGEIWIGGEQVGRGYIDPALTAKAFLDHPRYGRLYRSGDIGRLLADGSLAILGREDDQVKLRGQRIELGEINSAILRCEGVEDAVSMIIDADGEAAAKLVSFLTPRQPKGSGTPAEADDAIYDQLSNTLPSYMIPDALICLDYMPLTRQGKIDRRNLIDNYRALDAEQLQAVSRGKTASEDAGAFSEDERIIAQVICDSLGVQLQAITRNSSFYALGLDSISAIHVARKLRDHYPSVEISTLLQNPSVGRLHRFLSSDTEKGRATCSRLDLTRHFAGPLGDRIRETYSRAGLEVEKILPCTPLQESMATTAMNASSQAYQNTLRFEVHGEIRRLREAWEHALARHQILRTGFAAVDSAAQPFVQVVLKNFQLPWSEDASEDARLDSLERLMVPPWSLTASRARDKAFRLTLRMHHCLYDAEAMSILLFEIETHYRGHYLPKPVPFDSYLSFMEASDTDRTYEFWRSKLDGASLFKLSDAILPQNKIPSGTVSRAQRQSIISLSEFHQAVRKLSSTPLVLLQASWSRLLCSIFQTQDVCFGNVLSGRNLAVDGVDRIVGPCFNTLPMRIRLQRDSSNQELCHNCQQMNVEVLPYQSSSLRRMQRELDTMGKTLFDTLILLQQDQPRLDHNIWTMTDDSGDMSFPFILEIVMDTDADNLSLVLHSEVAHENALRHLLHAFDGLLVHTAKYPQARALDYSSATHALPKLHPTAPFTVGRTPVATAGANGSIHAAEILSDTETQIKDILLELKPGVSRDIFKDTTIFHLGFDSINAVQIAARLRKQGLNISSGDILEAASVHNIASLCNSKREGPAPSLSFDLVAYDRKHRQSICQVNGIERPTVQHVWPCTPTQTGILSQYLRSNRKLYFNHMRFELELDIDLSRLRRAWAVTMKTHKMLRTGFAEVDDPKAPFAMIIYKTGAKRLPWFDETSEILGDVGDLRYLQWRVRVSTTGPSPVLELSMLHAIYDARSLDIILNDVACIYNGTQPQQIDLAPTVSKILGRSADESSKAFWSELSTDISPTRFPDMRIYNNKTTNHTVSKQRCSLSCSTLEEACAEAGATIQALVAAAWASLLSAYTAQRVVTFGVILSGRDFEEDENKVAFPCINTVPLAIPITPDPARVLADATKRCAGVLKHQHTPLNSIKRWAGIDGEPFDSVIVLQRYGSTQESQRPWTQVEDSASAEYAVSLEILPREDGAVDLQLTCREDVVPVEQASHILREYDALLRKIIAPAAESSKLPESVLSVLPAKDARIATEVKFLHEFVELTAKRRPDNIALEFVTSLKGSTATKQTWTYSQLDSSGNQMACLIQKNGVQAGELVGVCFEKCAEASFAILGILKAGCGYIAIDPGAPATRKEFILKDSGCHLVLTTEDKLSDFTNLQEASVLAVDNDSWQDLPPDKPLTRELSPEDTCYCLYTSGTTGTPKGCLISHDSAVQAMMSFQRIFQGRWNDTSRWLQFASFHFDVSVLEQYWSWSVGIRVTSAPRDLLFEDLPGSINALQITHLDLTPSLARLLTPDDVPSLCDGVFIVGGEQVRQDILETWGDTGCLYNFYGPSEVTIGCTVHRQVPKNAKPTNIGQQWDNVGSFVLEPGSQQPVLRGAVGELCLSGPLVGKGYLNRPELTAEKFVTMLNYNTRLYRTGDLVRLLHDDSFEFLGRIDDQVKLRGQRLEIGEINHIAVASDSRIKDVATMVLKHPSQQRDHLVAFFSIAQRKAKNESPNILRDDLSRELAGKIRENCSNRLPAYMVPTYILALSSLPLSVNNKVDHKSLKGLYEANSTESEGAASEQPGVSTNGSLEASRKVAEVLASFLQIPASSIKPSSRLFELGVDSISAIGLARIFQREGFKNADVATVLRHPVVQDLAQAVAQESAFDSVGVIGAARKRIQSFAETHRASVCRAMKLRAADLEYIAPCTPLQEGMISRVMRGRPDDTVYFSEFCFELEPEIDMVRLKEAWQATQQSISVLRTFFLSTADGYAQVVLRDYEADIKIFSHKNKQTQATSFRDWVKSVRSLSTSLPWSVELTASGSSRRMHLYIFHGLYDGNSLPKLLNQVKRYYTRPGDDLTPPMQFYQALPYGPLCQLPDERRFWQSQFPSFKRHGLPLTDSKHQNMRGPIVLTDSLVLDNLQARCNKLDITTSAFFQAMLLYALQAQLKVNPSIGIVVSGRTMPQEGLEDVIGPMFNTIPCAINGLRKGAKLADLIRACHKLNVDVIPYQHTPLRKIARYLDQDINKGLFDTLFVFQKSPAAIAGDELWEEIPTRSSPDYPLNIEVEQQGPSFRVTVVAKPAYVTEDGARHLFKTYLSLVTDSAITESTLPPEFCEAPATPVLTTNGIRSGEQTVSDSAPEPHEETAMSEVEMAVRSQLAELASVEEETIHRDGPTMFELGLDSIEAMKLAARLKEVGLKVPVSAIMKAPTVAGIARAATSNVDPEGPTSSRGKMPNSIAKLQSSYRTSLQAQGIDLDEVEYILPVTPMQEGLLLESEKYLNVMTFRLEPGVDLKRLVAAWQTVSQTQPILRFRFATLESADQDVAFVQYVVKEATRVQVLRNSKLHNVVDSFRSAVSKEDASAHGIQIAVVDEVNAAFLVLAMPHALYDAWSLYLLHQQVAKTYHSPTPAPTGLAIGSLQSHLEQVFDQSSSRGAHTFWDDQLKGIQPTTVSPEVARSSPAFLLHRQSHTQLETVFNFCKHQGVTLQSLGLACWTITLAHITCQLDVCFGLVLSGRTTEGSEQLIFPTFNTVIFRPRIRQDSTKAGAVKRVHDVAVGVSEHQHFSLREALRIVRSSGTENQLFNTLFTFQKLPSSPDDVAPLYNEFASEATPIRPPYPVNIELESGSDGLVWTIACQEGVASETCGRELLEKLDNVLAGLLKQPDQPLLRVEDSMVSFCGLPGIALSNGALPERKDESTPVNDEDDSQTPRPWTATETIIREVLANIAKVDKDQIKQDTGIFHLGLDSVSAIRVANLLRKEGIKVPVSGIIREHTIKKIAVLAEQLKLQDPDTHRMLNGSAINELASQTVKSSLAIPEVDIEAVMSATGGQCYMLDMWSASGGRLFYPKFWLKVSNSSQEDLNQAFQRLVRGVPALRTLFVHRKINETAETWQVILKDEAVNKHDLPWTFHIEDQGSELLVSLHIHHALYDAVSFQLLVGELQRLCGNRISKMRHNTAMSSFVSNTRSSRDMAQDFWTAYLHRNANITPPIARGSFAANRVEKFVPRLLPVDKLSEHLKHHGLSIQALFFATYARSYASIRRAPPARQESNPTAGDVVLGVYLANRSLDIDGVTDLIAPTFNIVPLKIQLDGKSLLDSALQVQHDIAEVTRLENCAVSMRDIYAWTGVKIDTFVNFLTLPSDHENDDGTPGGTGKQVEITHAKVNPERKVKLEDADAPSPFVKDTDQSSELSKWCLVSRIDNVNSLESANADSVPAARH